MWRAPVRALALALFDRGGGVPADRVEWALDDLASFLAHAGPRTSTLFSVAVALVEWAPAVISGRVSRMSRLSPVERDRYLERLDASRWAILLVLPKALLSLVYYEHPDALRETGYDGTCLVGAIPDDVGLVSLPARGRASKEGPA